MVSLFSVFTVIATVWILVLFLCAIGGEEVAVILGIVMTLPQSVYCCTDLANL